MKQQLARKGIRAISAGLLAIATIVGLSLVAAAPAQAAPARAATAQALTAAGGSCKLSANWTVKFSVDYTDLGSRKARTKYLVMNSPGAIKEWDITIYQTGVAAPLWGTLTYLHPANLQRVNTTVTGTEIVVLMEVWGGSGYCDTAIALF